MTKPEYSDSDLARWKEALSSGSALRFDQGSSSQVVHTLGELETYLQLDPGTLVPVSPQVAESLDTIEDLQKTVDGLLSTIGELQARIVELEATPAPSALPDNALELIQTAGGLTKPKAEAVLAALTQASPTTEAASQ